MLGGVENVFVDIKDGEERSQVNCQNSNAVNEARDRTPIAQLQVRQEPELGNQVTSSSFTGNGNFGPGTGLGG